MIFLALSGGELGMYISKDCLRSMAPWVTSILCYIFGRIFGFVVSSILVAVFFMIVLYGAFFLLKFAFMRCARFGMGSSLIEWSLRLCGFDDDVIEVATWLLSDSVGYVFVYISNMFFESTLLSDDVPHVIYINSSVDGELFSPQVATPDDSGHFALMKQTAWDLKWMLGGGNFIALITLKHLLH